MKSEEERRVILEGKIREAISEYLTSRHYIYRHENVLSNIGERIVSLNASKPLIDVEIIFHEEVKKE